MRVSCSVPTKLATSTLVSNLRDMGLDPIVGPEDIDITYEGSRAVGDALIEMFLHECDHSVVVDFSDEHPSKQSAHYGTPPRPQGFGPKLNAEAPQKG